MKKTRLSGRQITTRVNFGEEMEERMIWKSVYDLEEHGDRFQFDPYDQE